MRRRNDGAELRSAMRAAGLTIPRLAAATRKVDADGVGISQSMIGFLVSTGKSARDECSDRAADLIARALNHPVTDLFIPDVSVVADSTSTPRGEMQTTTPSAGPEPLMTTAELRRYLKKSESWIDAEIREGRLPVIYAGRSRRFDRLQVLAALAAPAAA